VAPEATEGIKQGDELTVDLATGEISDLTSGVKYQAQPLPPFMQELVAAGGLLAYLKTRAAAK
jgi:3-isopropylmalate/(R)-2-methylmalate dehydratase small subunit